MSSKSAKPCGCVTSDEIFECHCSETDSATETECSTMKTNEKRKLSATRSEEQPQPKRQKGNMHLGESSDDSSVKILHVEEGKVQWDVEIVRVQKSVRRSVDIEVIKVIPGNSRRQVERVSSSVVDGTGDIRIVHVQGSAETAYFGQKVLHQIDLTKDMVAENKGRWHRYFYNHIRHSLQFFLYDLALFLTIYRNVWWWSAAGSCRKPLKGPLKQVIFNVLWPMYDFLLYNST